MTSLLLLVFALARPAPAIEPAVPGREGTLVPLDPLLLTPTLPLSPALQTALATRDHATAVAELRKIALNTLGGPDQGDLAFLLAWSLLRSGKGPEAVPLLDKVRAARTAPAGYVDLTLGEILVEADRPVEAAAALLAVDPSVPVYARARLRAADAFQLAGATADAVKTWEELAGRPDPAEGTEVALWALANKAGVGSAAAYPHLRRLWARYPATAEAAKATDALGRYEPRGAMYKATDDEVARRGTALMDAGRWRDAASFLASEEARFPRASPDACRAWYARGRSLFKANDVTEAAAVLAPAGEKCAVLAPDEAARSLYIAGQAHERKKEWVKAAGAYQRIPELVPSHSMADDGYALAGIAWQNAGDVPRAIGLWEAQVSKYADGDLAAEGFWRLAWNDYRAGRTEEALQWAEQSIWEVPIQRDPSHVLAAHYWAARWRVWPNVRDPRARHPDAARVEQGARLLLELCRSHPSSFYALLAAQRLRELDPAGLAAIPRPLPPAGQDGVWMVRQGFAEDPATRRGLALARLGLAREAVTEFKTLGLDALAPSEAAIVYGVFGRSDWVVAHDKLHHYLLQWPPEVLGSDADPILRQAHPDRHWDLVQQAATDFGYDPRIFHALAREESSFNERAVSFSGARGLSQLMPPTARQVAGWLGLKVTNDQLFDPLINLRIGSRYLDYLREYFKGNMFLAVAAYNAGEGNVGRWLRETGDVPTDEFIESIPIRETRQYVKRVLGTYQTYHVLYDVLQDGDPLFADWSATAHHAVRKEG